MKMYHWTSELFEQYLSGDIIVLAESVESARVMVREHFHKMKEKLFYYLDEEELAEKLEILESDIALEPLTETVIFINGSC